MSKSVQTAPAVERRFRSHVAEPSDWLRKCAAAPAWRAKFKLVSKQEIFQSEANHEYFLHHRRRGCDRCGSRFSRSACLKKPLGKHMYAPKDLTSNKRGHCRMHITIRDRFLDFNTGDWAMLFGGLALAGLLVLLV
jgi:hypothetical protein